MSSYGRTYDAVVAILEAYGIDPNLTVPLMYKRHEDGTTELIPLADHLADTGYDAAYALGERVAVGRLTDYLKKVMYGED